jgi:hypothetical protein
MVHPIPRHRVQSLKNFVKSLALVAVLVSIGFMLGGSLGVYFMPTIKPKYVEGIPQYVCGLVVLPYVILGGFFGTVGGLVAGTYIARRAWWKSPADPTHT